jgi:hypothetical protein
VDAGEMDVEHSLLAADASPLKTIRPGRGEGLQTRPVRPVRMSSIRTVIRFFPSPKMASPHPKTSTSLRAGRADALPPDTPSWITPKLVRRTIETWQPFYEEPLTLDDAVTILTSVGRLFEVLSRDG